MARNGPFLLLLFFVIVLFSIAEAKKDAEKALSKEQKRANAKKFVMMCNIKAGGKWKAQYNERFATMTKEQKKQLCGETGGGGAGPGAAVLLNEIGTTEDDELYAVDDELLANAQNEEDYHRRQKRAASCTYTTIFDARDQWPDCKDIINIVQDQSSCGNCWAVSVASAFTDRYCIERAKKGQKTSASDAAYQFSAADLTSCADNGCKGGTSTNAWRYTKDQGIVSGTGYTWKSGCKPYPFEPYGYDLFTAPACTRTCTNGAWPSSYNDCKKYSSWTNTIHGSVEDMEKELKANGTIVCSINVYSGYMFYKKGVYKHTESEKVGDHAVRCIGWGKQTCSDGTSQEYWHCINSWNTDWGDGGHFLIAKGSNECGIESKQVCRVWDISYGTPVPK